MKICVAFLSLFLLTGFSFFERPILLTVPFVVGGPTDIVARHAEYAIEKMTEYKIAVLNRGGASGNLGLREFHSKTKGLLVTTENIFTNQKYMKESYPVGILDNIDPIFFIGRLPNIIYAHNKIVSFQHLVEESYKRDIIIGSAAPGSGSYETYDMLCNQEKILKSCRIVIYKSAGDAIRDLITGTIDFYSSLYPAHKLFTGHGTVSPILVLAKNRSDFLPHVPSSGDLGYNIENISWHGVFGKGLTVDERKAIYNALNLYFDHSMKKQLGYEIIQDSVNKFWYDQTKYYENLYRK